MHFLARRSLLTAKLHLHLTGVTLDISIAVMEANPWQLA